MRSSLPVARLRHFVTPPTPTPRCELCAGPIHPDAHEHIVEHTAEQTVEGAGQRSDGSGGGGSVGPVGGPVRCVCRACWVVMDHPDGRAGGRQAVPRDVRHDPTHDPAAFAALASPVRLLYVVLTVTGPVVRYPGPAGLAVADVDPGSWQQICDRSPLAAALRPAVEGLLLIDQQAWLVGIDRCHALAARLRGRWQGLDGGPAVSAMLVEEAMALDRLARPIQP